MPQDLENGFGSKLQAESRIGEAMVKTYIVKKGQKPTEEQIRAIKEAKKHPITFDKDCEELSPAMQKAFRCAVIQRNRRIHEERT